MDVAVVPRRSCIGKIRAFIAFRGRVQAKFFRFALNRTLLSRAWI